MVSKDGNVLVVVPAFTAIEKRDPPAVGGLASFKRGQIRVRNHAVHVAH